jgi:hypothetical protein
MSLCECGHNKLAHHHEYHEDGSRTCICGCPSWRAAPIKKGPPSLEEKAVAKEIATAVVDLIRDYRRRGKGLPIEDWIVAWDDAIRSLAKQRD